MQEAALEAAHRLVRTVARAFYADDTIVVLDALVRERYLSDKNLPERIGLTPKLSRKLLTELQAERLIKTEQVAADNGKRELYYYLDYNHFTNVVRYRVYLMQKELERMEREANENQSYDCPTCGYVLSILEIQPLRNQRFAFCCPVCCNNDLHALCEGGTAELRPRALTTGYEEMQALKEKLKRQMLASDDSFAPHDGIFNLLSLLQGKPLPSNIPSELIALGLGDDGEGGRGRRRGRAAEALSEAGREGMNVFEEMASMTRDGAIQADEEDGEGAVGVAVYSREKKALPEFLRGSRVLREVTTADGGGGDHDDEIIGGMHARPAAASVQPSQKPPSPPPEVTESQRREAYRRAFMEQVQKELKGGDMVTPKVEGTPAVMNMTVKPKAEDEDIDWEEAEEE